VFAVGAHKKKPLQFLLAAASRFVADWTAAAQISTVVRVRLQKLTDLGWTSENADYLRYHSWKAGARP
jgi:hypothetical protein